MAEAFPGRFIVLDGPEGCGKTTQVQHLVARLREEGRQATAVRDPGSTPVSERIRKVLLDKRLPEMHVRTELFLYMASRAEMVARIVQPLLEGGLVVVSDRFVSSSVAYQGFAGGIEPALIWEMGRVAADGIEPDLTILLDLEVEAGFARIAR
ncbi:MAG: dTMP kinase, partial [Phycisphaerae bacterium]